MSPCSLASFLVDCRHLALLFICVAMLGGCAPSDDQAAIRKQFNLLVDAIESRNNAKARSFLSEHFLGGVSSGAKMNKEELRRYLAGFFLRYRKIEVVSYQHDITLFETLSGEPSQAQQTFNVRILSASQVIPDFSNSYTVTLDWHREGSSWRVSKAIWSVTQQ